MSNKKSEIDFLILILAAKTITSYLISNFAHMWYDEVRSNSFEKAEHNFQLVTWQESKGVTFLY